MLQISKFDKLEFDQYLAAVQFAQEQLGYLGDEMTINPHQRFTALAKMGVELALARDQEEILGICFILPDQTPIKHHKFVWLFGMVTKPEGKNIGALMLFKMMHWYPAIMCVGVTEMAGKLYRALRWQEYSEVWRCVHPIDLSKMVERYKERIKDKNQIRIIKSLGPVYNLGLNFGRFIANLLILFGKSQKSIDSPILAVDYRGKIDMVSQYRNLYTTQIGSGILEVVNTDGIARVVRDELFGRDRLFAHMQMWKELKSRGVFAIEFIATSLAEKRRAFLYGYAPLRMPIHYWDKYGQLSDFFKFFPGSNFTFASCDKIL